MKIMCNGFVLPSVPHRDLNMACITIIYMQTYLIIITHVSSPKRQQGLEGGIWYLLHAVVKMVFKGSAVSSLFDRSKRFTLYPLAALSIPTPTRLLLEAF